MLTITLYTKEGCHLCEDVKGYLALREWRYPHKLVEVDITQDHDLFARYRYSIPVIKIGTTTLKAPITNHQLEQALAKESTEFTTDCTESAEISQR